MLILCSDDFFEAPKARRDNIVSMFQYGFRSLILLTHMRVQFLDHEGQVKASFYLAKKRKEFEVIFRHVKAGTYRSFL